MFHVRKHRPITSLVQVRIHYLSALERETRKRQSIPLRVFIKTVFMSHHLSIKKKSHLCIQYAKPPGRDLVWSTFRKKLYRDVAILDWTLCRPVWRITLQRDENKILRKQSQRKKVWWFLTRGELWNSTEQSTEKFLLLAKGNEDSGYEVVLLDQKLKARHTRIRLPQKWLL